MNTYRRSMTVATLVLLGGIAASLSGNVLAIGLESQDPSAGAYVSALVWPLMLFGAIELLIHTPWLQTKRDAWTKAATLILVAGVSLWESYWHLFHLLASYGYDVVAAHVGPLAVDAAMGLATLALNRVVQSRRTPEPQPVPQPVQATVEPAVDTPLADETSDWLAALTDRVGGQAALEAATSPAAPLEATKLPANEVNPESVPETAKLAFKVWATADPADRPRAGQMYEWVAGDHGVSPRTARRWWDATKANL